jgi:hypothetical protein
LLQLSRFFGLRELRFQMLTNVLFVIPQLIAKRALRTIDEIQTFFDERAPL